MIMSRLKTELFKKLALVTSLLLILFLATACSSSHDQNATLGSRLNYDYSPKEQSWDSPPEDQDPGSGLGKEAMVSGQSGWRGRERCNEPAKTHYGWGSILRNNVF